MSIFDSIIGMAENKFGLNGGKANGLVSALLSLIITDGGLSGFLGRFRNAGLGDTVDSWITTGNNAPLSGEQLESGLGANTVAEIAKQAGVTHSTATSALAAIVPQVVDRLTPDGEVLEGAGFLTKIQGYLGGLGGAAVGAVGAAGAMATDAFDRVSGSTENAAGAVGDKFNSTFANDRRDDQETGGSSILKWLLPLLLLALLVILGFMFCNKTPVTVTNSNSNSNQATVVSNANATAKKVDSSFSLKADNGKYTVTGTVADDAAKKQIVDALTAQYGAGNVNFDGLKVDANAKPFGSNWWANFTKLLPNLKDWKTGTLAFVGNSITEAVGLPAAALGQLKSLFTGWNLPMSVVGAEGATKQANEESLKELGEAASIDDLIKALNVSIINFASAKSDIPADAKPILEKAAEVMKKQPAGTTVEIGGYTDNQGNAEDNKKLSQARADSVKKALVDLGVSADMLKAVGFGDAGPVGDNTTEDGRFKNRRIEYKKADGTAPSATTMTTNTNTAR